MRCKTARASGSYTSSDWEKASKYTDNSALTEFINDTYNPGMSSMTNQIDGKIETWFQTTDPASRWLNDAMKAKHVGDMWYHTTNKELRCYRQTNVTINNVVFVNYAWALIEDSKAISAYEAASNAQDTADGKRRVFVNTPYPPYDVGDLWVDGKELRRCITSKTSSQSYNVNDWVVAVYYDNTKTTIDGGLVTSGTIQVAGDNNSILAGMTGNGTAASSIRFWAGASFENRATAPFRVQQDGSVVMTKATVEGIINAISGYIGGFKIEPGKIGYGTTSEQDTTKGLALLKDFIRFNNGTQRVLLGCLSSLGYPFNGMMELTDTMGTTLELYHKLPSTSDERYESWYYPKALYVNGNQMNVGKLAVFERGYIGTAYTDTIVSWIGITHKFLFTGTATSYIGVELPKKSVIDNLVNQNVVQFDIEIVCDRTMPNRICLYSKDGAYIYNNNGAQMGNIDMAKGDVIRLRYYNGGWNLLFRNY